MIQRCEVAIVGSGFAGSLLARVLAILGHDVILLERGTHPRFAIGESSTPLGNLSLERLAHRYGLDDCWQMAAHGRWTEKLPELGRGLKRGFTFYRHHPETPFVDRGLDSERLLVAASPSDSIADSHWLRADVDHHFVKRAVAAGVEYLDRVELSAVSIGSSGARLTGVRGSDTIEVHAGFVIDATGPGGFLARHLPIAADLERVQTHSAGVFAHFDGVRRMSEVAAGLPAGPYPDDWAAVHHLLDEGWVYSLRFDDGRTSAGLLLNPMGVATLGASKDATAIWRALLDRYPTLAELFRGSTPITPLAFRPRIQHRLSRAAGPGWAVLPHAYSFVDPLFSTGIAWSLRAVERLADAFESGTPTVDTLARYEAVLAAEADQIDLLIAGAYEAMAHFDLFAAQAMLYFAGVSFAETRQRLLPDETTPWSGFLGVGDPILEPLPRAARQRLRGITGGEGRVGTARDRDDFAAWVARAIAPRNVAGLADPARNHLYPVDLDALVDAHALLGLTRDQLMQGLPALRGIGREAPAPRLPAARP